MEQFSLTKIAYFRHLSGATLQQIENVLQARHLAAGQVLFNYGDPGDELIIVKSGQVAIYMPEPANPAAGQPIRIFQPGPVLGELALIDRQPRSASARALGSTTVLTLHAATFLQLLAQDPNLVQSVMVGMTDRIRYTTDFLNEVRRWVGKLSIGDYQALAGGAQTYQDDSMASLAAEFTQMASRVQQREEDLRRQVAELKVEIDETRRKKEVQEIVGSDYYVQLKEKIKLLRQPED